MRALIALSALLAPAAVLSHTASPWDGTWKLDRAKSHLTGHTITLSKTANGKWRYNDGTMSYEFALDGKPVTIIGDETIAATAEGERAWNLVFKSKSQESRTHLELSADGKTISDRDTGTRPDGSKTEGSGTMVREGKGAGFEGTWKSTKATGTSETFTLAVNGDHVKWEWPAYKRMVEGKMDGSSLPLTGAAATPGITFEIRKLSPTKLSFKVKGAGKTLDEGTLELTDNGKTITDTDWAPAKPKEKTIAVYVR